MTRSFLKRRLAALEQACVGLSLMRQPYMGGINLLTLLIAGHLGHMAEREAVAEGHARGLGYETVQHYRAALMAGEASNELADLNRRRAEAATRLLRLRGIDVGDSLAVRGALRALFEDLPGHVRRHPMALEAERHLDEAVDSLCA
ncbi:hypothetical protein [Methylobacterium sp. A54F]